MPKKLSLKELNVESFVTKNLGNVRGGDVPQSQNICPISINNGCLATVNDTCLSGESEYRTACEPKTQFPCYIEKDPEKFKL